MDNNVIKNIEKIIMIGHDQDGNEVRFNFSDLSNCVLVNQSFGVGGSMGYDVEFHAASHSITFDGEELFPVQGFLRNTKYQEFDDSRDSAFGKDLEVDEISW